MLIMSGLKDLILNYERELTTIEAQWLDHKGLINNIGVRGWVNDKLSEYSRWVDVAHSRYQNGVSEKPTDREINELYRAITKCDQSSKVPRSEIEVRPRKETIRQRILFYQDIFDIEGQFDRYEDLLIAKFENQEGYFNALAPLADAEKKLLDTIKTMAPKSESIIYESVALGRKIAKERISSILPQ
jgi:hypothetical protein